MQRRDYPTIKEYADAQKELGSCLPQFRSMMKRALIVGACSGVPFGSYVAWRHGHRRFAPFVAKAGATWFITCMTFTCMGLMAGTYNCLRVKM